MEVQVFATAHEADLALAGEIAGLVRAGAGRVVLGLATGRTPLGVYAELARMHRAEGLSFREVVTFNLDEFDGLAADDPGSFRVFMHEHLFDHVDLDPANVHLLPADAGACGAAACAEFEAAIRAAGGIDLQVLGIGLNGHVGFNEPGSPADSRTRRVALHPVTRRSYGASLGRAAPTHALTMGIATIREARALRVLAFGRSQAELVARFFAGEPRAELPATLLRDHPDARVLVDAAAATGLARSTGETH
jgi:glucosamine-6-phosphate deaminase